MMDDKEVGEAWLANKIPIRNESEVEALQTLQITQLIRKLHEERTNQIHAKRFDRWDKTPHSPADLCSCPEDALRDFGIPPEDFK